MRRVTIGCGVGFDRFGKQIAVLSRDVLKSALLKVACERFGGATFIDTFGAWRDNTGKDIIEPGWSIVLYTDKGDDFVKQFALYVRNVMGQESVVLVVEEIAVQFV